MNTNIQRTESLVRNKVRVLIDPSYLKPMDKQKEKQLLQQRTLFLEFQRYMYELSNKDIEKLFTAFTSARNKGDIFCICNEYYLLQYSIHFQLCLRDIKCHFNFEETVDDYKSFQKSSDDFPEVTSRLLINFAKHLLIQYPEKMLH